LVGAKGTSRSVRRPRAPRQFPAGYVLVPEAAAAGTGELLVEELEDVLLVLLVEEGALLEELLLLLESELLEPSFFVEL